MLICVMMVFKENVKEELIMKILNFGSMNLDHVYQVPHFSLPGESLSVTELKTGPGGKGLNQSIAMAKAGAKVYHGGCLGDGGAMLQKLLEENGVDTSLLCPVAEAQGHAIIQVAPNGENSILYYGGSNRCVTEAQIEATLAPFTKGDLLVLQNEIVLLPEIIEKAFAKGLTILLNPSPFDEVLQQVDFGKLDWLIINELEAGFLTGSQDPDQAWEVLHGRYPRLSVVITLGGAGSRAYQVHGDKVEKVCQDAFKVQAVDTTGAGDTFTGYFAAGLMRGDALEACMKTAAMAAAISVTRPGAASSVPMRAEVELAMAQL